MSNDLILAACKKGSGAWQAAFNEQNAKGCAAAYNDNAVIKAEPFGTFQGTKAIVEFWQGIIDKGFSNVEYTNIKWEPFEDKGYTLSSSWTMNKAYGLVHREHWIVEDDGFARMIRDEFEVQGER